VRVIARLYAANGVNVDLELALFDADHNPGAAALSRARKALADRPSVLGHDVLAWNLFRVGKLAEAAKESALALRLGSVDPQFQYHAAAIAFARGDRTSAAQHLQLVLNENPRFSALLAPDVEHLKAMLH
jgi:tetratricopeptide (TPR) repeat protein